MISDETAYRRYLDGQEHAADLLVERYGDGLTLYINGYIRDVHEAEDLMIEAFSQLFAKGKRLRRRICFYDHMLSSPLFRYLLLLCLSYL